MDDARAEERVVTEEGRVTVPKPLREKHGISVPGCVAFVENEAGELVVRPVGSMREFRGLDREGDENRSATERFANTGRRTITAATRETERCWRSRR